MINDDAQLEYLDPVHRRCKPPSRAGGIPTDTGSEFQGPLHADGLDKGLSHVYIFKSRRRRFNGRVGRNYRTTRKSPDERSRR